MVLPSKTKVGDDADFSDLQFMIFTDYKQTANAETKRKVRSHVQSRIQRDVRNQKSKEKKGEIALNISALSQSGGNPSQPPADSKTWSLVTRAPMRLGAGRSDPFKSYPIEMDVRTHELFDHCECTFLSYRNQGQILADRMFQYMARLVLCSRHWIKLDFSRQFRMMLHSAKFYPPHLHI